MARIIIEEVSKERFDEIVANALFIDATDANHWDYPISELPYLIDNARGLSEDIRYGLFCNEQGEYRLGELGNAYVD